MDNLEKATFSESDDRGSLTEMASGEETQGLAEVSSAGENNMQSLMEVPSFEERMAEKKNYERGLFEKIDAISDQADKKLATAMLGTFFAKESKLNGSQSAVAKIISDYDENEGGFTDYLKAKEIENEHSENPNEVMLQKISDLITGDRVQREVEADKIDDEAHVESAVLRVLARDTLDAQGGEKNEKNDEEMKIIGELYNYGQKPQKIEEYTMRVIQKAADGDSDGGENFSEKVMICGKVANEKHKIDKAYASYKNGLAQGEEMMARTSTIEMTW